MVAPLHDITLRQCAGIGRVAVEWARVEETLQQFVWLLLGVHQEIGRKLTTELGARTLYDMILALAHDRRRPDDDQAPIYSVMHNLRSKIDELRGRRNHTVHTDWHSTEDKKAVHSIRFAAVGKYRVQYTKMKLKEFSDLADEIAELDRYLMQTMLAHRDRRLQAIPSKARKRSRLRAPAK